MLPAPDGYGVAGGQRVYLIGPYDKLKIDVFGAEELSKTVQADASGKISIPLVGVVEASGRTPADLALLIAERLRGKYLKNPEVSVNLEETLSQVVTVDGEVKKPGLYPVIGPMTLMRAIARAEGLSEMARRDEVVVFRTVRGQKYAAVFNLAAIRRGAYADPDIYADDIVVVGESARRKLLDFGVTALPSILTPLIYLLR
jgi:polysaccharide export outer membrane protein